jgi:hypothetical protein
MSLNLPVDFEKLTGKTPTPGGYPYQLKATDLQKNFVYAALDADASLIENKTGPGGHTQRRLKIPALPGGGTYILGSVAGTLTWIATEEC